MRLQPTIAFFIVALCCTGLGAGCAPESRQGSADDLSKGRPPDPCPPPEDVSLGMDDPTVLGISATELLEGVLPLETQPLFWVPYDDLFAASYLPGVSATRVTLEIRPRATDSVVEHVFDEPDSSCRASRVDVPVSIGLRTVDGALDEHLDGVLRFFTSTTAGLSAFVAAETIAGSFGLMPTAKLARWELMGLSLGVSIWQGGSRGSLAPELRELGSDRPPDPGPPAARNGIADGLTPALPRHWDLLAVWPRREACGQDPAYAAEDQLGGWSPGEVVRDVTSRGAGALRAAEGSTPVHFTLESPTELMCVVWAVEQPSDFSLRVPGRLKADETAPASTLQHLDASATFELTGHVLEDGSGVQSLSWQQPNAPFVVGQAQADFAVATGLALDASDPGQQFVWSWHGNSTRGAAGDWTTTGQFTVQSAREREGKECEATPEPPRGTNPAVCTTFPFSEVGDTLVSADFVP